MFENEEQRPGNDRTTKVSRALINSAAYRRKFDNISDDPRLNRLLYKLAKKMLLHRSGTSFEDMYWIDSGKVEVVAKELDATEPECIYYSRKTRRTIQQNQGLLAIHSHPNSYPPSIADFNSCYDNQYMAGIVFCHDGRIFMYGPNHEVSADYFNLLVEEFFKINYNVVDAQIAAIEKIQNDYHIEFKEVLE